MRIIHLLPTYPSVELPCALDHDLFELARKAKRDNVSDREAVEHIVHDYCRKSGKNFQESLEEFWSGFHRVEHPENSLDIAVQHAVAHPVPLVKPALTELRQTVASIAYYLAERVSPDPFFLPRQKLGDMLHVSAMAISRAVTALEKDGILVPGPKHLLEIEGTDGEVIAVERDYSRTRKSCKLYHLDPTKFAPVK